MEEKAAAEKAAAEKAAAEKAAAEAEAAASAASQATKASVKRPSVKIGQRVVVNGHSGVVRYVGPHKSKEGNPKRIGVELDEPVGKSSGTFDGQFSSSLVLLTTPPPSPQKLTRSTLLLVN